MDYVPKSRTLRVEHRSYSCGQAPDDISRVAVVDKGMFQGFAKDLPAQGPIVTDRGMVTMSRFHGLSVYFADTGL